MSARLAISALACACVIVCCSGDAAAADREAPEDRESEKPAAAPPSAASSVSWEIGAAMGYLTPPIRGGTTPFGIGFGGRLGFVASNVYVGAKVLAYLGGKDVDLSDRAVVAGIELGYSLRLLSYHSSYLALRPEVGLGDAVILHSDPSLVKVDVVTSASGRASTSSTSDTTALHTFHVAPTLQAIFVSESHFIALSGGAMIVPRISYGSDSEPATWLSYGLDAEIGLRF